MGLPGTAVTALASAVYTVGGSRGHQTGPARRWPSVCTRRRRKARGGRGAAAHSKFDRGRVALVGAVGFRLARGPGALRVRRAAARRLLCALDCTVSGGAIRAACEIVTGGEAGAP